ncbi:MAG: peptide deformylase [Pseudomonadota bacterium]
MALREILEYPDPILHQSAAPVTEFAADLEGLVDDLADTMEAHNAIGLSAPQLGKLLRVMIINPKELDDDPLVLINPTILEKSLWGFVQESCLSVPGIVGSVMRATKIKVSAQDMLGSSFEEELSGMPAVCVQHELDHLDGKLFIDRFSLLGRMRVRYFSKLAGRRRAA